MKVLHCIPTLGGGGAERQLAYLAAELRTLGWEVHIAYGHDGPYHAVLAQAGAVLHRLHGRGNHDPRLLWQLRRLISKIQPDLVQTWLFQMDILAGLASTWAGVPWILSERSSPNAWVSGWKHQLRVRIGGRAAAVAANSRGGAEFWTELLSGRGLQVAIPNALPHEAIAAAPAVLPNGLALPAGHKLLVHVGRLSAEKNIERLVHGVARLPPTLPVTLALCGDGPLREPLEQLTADLGLAGRVHFAGYTRSVWSWLKSADLMISTSLFEGQPNAVLEAIACGCPLVVSDISEHRELLGEDAALLVDPHDVGAIAVGIGNVLGDPEQARRRAQRASELVAELTPSAMARRYHELYLRVLGRSAADPHEVTHVRH